MAKSRRASHKFFITFIGFFIIFIIGFVSFRYFYKPSSANIFLVDTSSIQYGATTLTGSLQKDTAIGIEGNYLLILTGGRTVLLDIQGLDKLVHKSVSVTGTLSPASAPGLPLNMTVDSIKIN